MKTELITRHYMPALAITAIVPTVNINTVLTELNEAFTLLENWDDKYQYIIDLGKNLPALPASVQTDAHILHGCQSRVWLGLCLQNGLLFMHAASDAVIVNGLIALVAKIYNGRTPAEILSTPPAFLHTLGLATHLSPTRSNGLHALITAVQTVAAHVQQQTRVA